MWTDEDTMHRRRKIATNFFFYLMETNISLFGGGLGANSYPIGESS